MVISFGEAGVLVSRNSSHLTPKVSLESNRLGQIMRQRCSSSMVPKRFIALKVLEA